MSCAKDGECDVCHKLIEATERHMQHRFGALLCWPCADKMTLAPKTDWERKDKR